VGSQRRRKEKKGQKRAGEGAELKKKWGGGKIYEGKEKSQEGIALQRAVRIGAARTAMRGKTVGAAKSVSIDGDFWSVPMRRLAILVAIFVTCTAVGISDAGVRDGAGRNARGGGNAQLGTVNFPTSCAAAVQATMEKGVALLHSFQYQQASSTFSEAAQQDPQCAMARWGEAMALYHQLWDFPDVATLAKGRGYVEEAQKIGGKTERERDYIAAAGAFYANEPKLSHTARVEAYARAMDKARRDSPEDVDSAAFDALALVNLADYEDELPNRKRAIAILEPMFERHPDHPGLAHYLIHATDTPELAREGLTAARAYAKIAPDSSHALHMPSHIFTRLGLWQESIDSNIAASAAAAKATEAHQADADYQFHAMDFLDYAYLQCGQEGKAREVTANLKNVAGGSAEDVADHEGYFAARNALELQRWKEAASLAVPNVKLTWQDATYLAHTIGAARSGDAKGARVGLKKLEEVVSAQRHEEKHMGYGVSSGKSLVEQKAEAWVEFAEGKKDEAIKTMRMASEREEAAGVDSLAIPAREMLGDMLMELKRPGEALEAYKLGLRESPNRFDGLWGAAQAAHAAGNEEAAKEYSAKLVEIAGAAGDRPELQEARGYMAAK
jgi:tetratricopeptide (TPR) repeat protein